MSRVFCVKRSLAASVIGGLVAVGFVPGLAKAQTQPVPPMLPSQPGSPSQGTVAPGSVQTYLNNRNDSDRRAPNIRDTYGTYENGYPASDMRIAVDANARAAFTRMELRRVQDALDAGVHLMELNFNHSKELTDAVAAEQQAYEDYLAARETALRPVHDDARFQANDTLKKELGERIVDEHDKRNPDKVEIVSMSLAKLGYATVARDMESHVLQDDSHVQAARQKLMEAGQRVKDVRDNFDMQVRTSPELALLRRQLEEARTNAVVAATYSEGAIEAANVALDFAYYRERYNFYSSYPYTDTLAGYGAGNTGYGYPVGVRY